MSQNATKPVSGRPACTAVLKDEILTLSTGRLERRYRWNGGALIGEQLMDVNTGDCWSLQADGPDLVLPGLAGEPEEGTLDVEQVPGGPVDTAHVRAVVTVRLGRLAVRRTFRLYPDCPAIACDLALRGRGDGPWRSTAVGAMDRSDIESTARARRPDFFAPVTERLPLHHRHTRLTCVALRDATDWHNNLVHAETRMPWARIEMARGNLVLIEALIENTGVFLLKEAPLAEAQLAYPDCDVRFDNKSVQMVGLGLDPADLREDVWVEGYGTVIGMARGGETGLLRALRDYQHRLRARRPDRDASVLVNTWGDRNKDNRISESFALAELASCARLGASHLQLDDGWQTGQTYVAPDESYWQRSDHWAVHPERFPNGLEPVIQRGKELGVEVALWFAPSRANGYADWEKDAQRLVELHRTLGVRMFKIDLVEIPDRAADRRFRAMLDRVLAETDGQVVFNLDATAGRRLGYFDGNRYGLVFLENRYTDWQNYYPHWTLRNLWQLARYVPPQRFQIEWLNIWRNANQYPQDDPLAPRQVGFEYAFATTLAAHPLGWFEACNLPEAAFEIVPLVKAYRAHQAALHASPVLPIGEEPTGTSWPGFQSVGDHGGYLLVYRELNARPKAQLATWLDPGTAIMARPVIGHGASFEAVVDEASQLPFSLAQPMSWCLYQYEIRK
ncbi:alpha-galactosidase [Phycisphaerales bacterium AB-hyl4]|uniref:Alpha-galactosidase n=1 Tax=Natronomicrosphaera hydrolytica TaxID=3242702 RepID=A0ABV4U887_9BACT